MGVASYAASLVVVVMVMVVVMVLADQNSTRSRPSWEPRLVASIPLKHAAFMEAIFSEDANLDYIDRWTLYISTFDPLGGTDKVYRVRSPGRHLDDPHSWQLELMDDSAYWPNDPCYLPGSVTGEEGVIWTSGFLVPGKTSGQLQLYHTREDSIPWVNIASLDKTGWSYHRVEWKDMDGDGDLDALTARFHKPILGRTKKQLVWLENPHQGFVDGWKQHVIADDGPDISFALVTLSAGGREYDCVVVGEFFSQRTAIYWTESEDFTWTDASLVRSRVINAEAGQVFDVLVGDFNSDGQVEFMASEYSTDLKEGQVTVYFFPEDFRTDNFTSVKIADSFHPYQALGASTMSPGTPKAYYPTADFEAEMAEDGLPHKPYILLSGDDDGRVYVLYPESDARDDWTYQKHILLDTEGKTTGAMAHGDFDGDGFEEIVAPGYSVGRIYLYTYNP